VRVVDGIGVRANPDRTLAIAAAVERWPEFLPHYRWVRVLERTAGRAIVEMAAWRPFGILRYPVWWVSEMMVDERARRITYRHVRGITTGMDVEWRVEAASAGSDVRIVHDWAGPGWPLIGQFAATAVIGPVFIHGIASRTLAGVKARAEAA
jgi:ribosome-associated toxin RatA of RatAB toxin-antitoxin module